MKHSTHYLILILLLTVGRLKAQPTGPVITSPDGNLVVTLSLEAGKPAYAVSLTGKPYLATSPLGLKTNVGDFTEGLSLAGARTSRKIDTTYTLPTIKKSQVHYVANEGVIAYSKDNAPAIDITFRVSNNDVAFRYKVYPQKASRSCVVSEEKTGFVLPTGTTTFLSAQSKAMVGFARTMPSYEIPYTVDDTLGENGRGNGYTFPCLFRVSTGGWVLLSETGVDSRYCGSRLIGHSGGLYTIGFPMPDENNGIGTSAPGLPLPGETPWRTITVGETLAPIVETTVPFDVVEPRY